jgi:putative addiction module CopG family antidote
MIQVPIPTEFEPFVRGAIQSGNYRNPTEMVGEALRLLARREQLLADIKAGVEQLDRGEYTEYGDDSLPRFLADIDAEDRARPGQEENRP